MTTDHDETGYEPPHATSPTGHILADIDPDNPLLKERSARAVERALGNIIDPERKKKAEEMLRELQQ